MWRKLRLLGASAALSLVLGEVAVRLVLPRPGFVAFPVAETRGVIQSDPERGYVYAPNLARHVVTRDYEIDFRTNSLGLRDVEPAQVDRRALRALAVGDSYTQGHGVQAHEAWPKRVQASLPGVHVFNAGVSGYGLQQMRRMAQVQLERLRPRVLFVGLYGHGYTRVAEPYVLVADGAGLVLSSMVQRVQVDGDGFLLPVFETPLLRAAGFWIDRHWFLAGHLMHGMLEGARAGAASPTRDTPGLAVLEGEMQPMLRELDALRSQTEQWQIPVVVLLVNPVEPDGAPSALQRDYNAVISAFARAHGICCIDPLPVFVRQASGGPLRLGGDPHWSPRAHALAADHLVDVLRSSLTEESQEGAHCQLAARVLFAR